SAGGEGTLRENYSEALLTLMAMAGLVLMVGCVNLANLQLARLIGREREMTVRRALGASRWRIVSLLFAENLLLAVVGTVLAIVVGRVSSNLLLHWASAGEEALPLELPFGWEMFAVAAALLVTALVAFSVFPAWRITGRDFGSKLGSRANTSLQSKGSTRLSGALLAGQVGFSVLLVGVAGLFAQTLRNLNRTEAGLDRDHVVSVHFDFSNAGYRSEALPGLYSRMLSRVKEVPGVRDAAISMCGIPRCVWNTEIHVAEHPEIPQNLLHGEENHVGV